MPEAVIHPSTQELSDFGGGKLTETAAELIAEHLEVCAVCRQVLEELPPDSFEGKLRTANSGEPSFHPVGVLSDFQGPTSSADDAPAVLPPPAGLPVELADCPKYHFLREPGRGGMGIVYEAEHRRMERRVAIKVIKANLLEHPDALARFQREVRAAARLSHPNIVRAHDAEQIGKVHLLVMEFVEGRNLAESVQQTGPLALPLACAVIHQTAVGLQHAFEQGVVHRDIKPSNLMLTRNGEVKILDFGLAQWGNEKSRGRGLTEFDSFLGTPDYVAPEQAEDPSSADIRADIYSLGCTFYYLLTGRTPFVENTAVKLILAQIEKEPPPLALLRPEVPAELARIVMRMLAKEPDQRFQTPMELAQALTPFLEPVAEAVLAELLTPCSGPTSSATGTMTSIDTSRVQKRWKEPNAKPPGKVGRTSQRSSAALFEVLVSGTPLGKRLQQGLRTIPCALFARLQSWPSRRSVAAILVLLGLIGSTFTAVVFNARVPGGTIVVEPVPFDAEIYVDQPVITLSRRGETVTITPAAHGPHRLTVVQGGQEIWSSDITVKLAGAPVRLQMIPTRTLPKKEEGNARSKPSSASQASLVAAERHDGQWVVASRGVWRIDGDEWVQEAVQGGWNAHPFLVFGSPGWSNYDLTLKAKWEQGPQGFGIFFHYKDPANHYFVYLGSYGNRGSELCWMDRGRWGREKHAYREHSLNRDQWYDVRLVVRGTQFCCFLDGDLLFASVVDRFTNGLVGIRAWGCAARFRDIQVTSPDGTVLWKDLTKLRADPAPAVVPSDPGKQGMHPVWQDLERMRTQAPPDGRSGFYRGRGIRGMNDVLDVYHDDFRKAVDDAMTYAASFARTAPPDAEQKQHFHEAVRKAAEAADLIMKSLRGVKGVQDAGKDWIEALEDAVVKIRQTGG